ncbi:MAG: Dabb family protein [Ktedonobacteraceae bacterium]|nr:Dabb family protein [Ktedonobacteraceae bacterium]MBV9614297.1 Dabb family protein [Ktedonobacteraceae bacterium]
MIVHTLLLQPKPETTNEEMQAVLERVKMLKQKIPGIVDVQAGKNKNAGNHGYTYGFIMRFVDEEHLQAYFPHPEHKAVSPELRRLCASLLNFDLSGE